MTTDELIEVLKRHPGLQVHLESPVQIAPVNEVDKDHFGEDCGDAFVVVIGADWDKIANPNRAAVLEELLGHLDETPVPGSPIRHRGEEIWVHTTGQVEGWLRTWAEVSDR